jgi:hypothetical protein
MSLTIQTSSFTLHLKPPVFKQEVLAFLESDNHGQIKVNPTCWIKRINRTQGDYYREPCPLVLSVQSAYSTIEYNLTCEDIAELKKLISADHNTSL